MTAQAHLTAVPDYTPTPTAPRWKVRAEREADRRHQALVTLEQLHRETPWWCIRARHVLHKAIVHHVRMGL